MQSVTVRPQGSSHEQRLQQTACKRRFCLHEKSADLGPKARMIPILDWMRKLGTSAERGLTMKDLQILVDQRVVRVAEDALVAVHDITGTVATGTVPSDADMERFFTKWLEQVQLSVAASVEMAKQRGMPLPPDGGNASLLLYSRESQNGFVHWQQPKKAQLKRRKSGCLNLFGREVRVLGGRFVYSMPSAHPRIDFHSIDFSLVLADVGIAMERARKAHRYVPAKNPQTL